MQTTGNTSLFFLYDANGLIGFDHIVSGTAQNTYYYQIDGKGEIVGITDKSGNVKVKYTYDAWGNPVSITDANGNNINGSNEIGLINPFRYKSYYYDTDTGLYYLNSRYYDPRVCRFVNSDVQFSIGSDITGTNLFIYCGNNPVTRIDDSGRGWWTFAGAAIGFLAGGATKIISNISTGKDWNEGVLAAALGGAVYGAVVASTGNIVGAGFASAATESFINEASTYDSTLALLNGKSVTKELSQSNIDESAVTIITETVFNGTITVATGEIAAKVIPTNNGWIKPQKFVSSFTGKYAIKSQMQTVIQSDLLLGVEMAKHATVKGVELFSETPVPFLPVRID